MNAVIRRSKEDKKQLIEEIKNKKNFINIFNNNFIFIVGVALLILKALFLNITLNLEIQVHTIIYTALVALLIMCPTINKKDKFAFIYLNVAYLIATIIIYANFLYYSYSTNFLSCYQIENLKYAKVIGSGALCIINLRNILMYMTDNILILLLTVILSKKIKQTKYNNKKVKVLIIVAICLLNFGVVIMNINNIYKEKAYNKSLIVQDISIYYYHYEDAKEYIFNMFIKEKVDEEKLRNAYENNLIDKVESTQYTGVAQDKNVIILQLESLNEYIIGKKVNSKEIMPNLNKFLSENIYCEEMYNQGLGTTADSEFEMANSMYPLENGYVFQKYYDNKWSDIYTSLRSKGYYTSFMHPNTSTFWNREEVYKRGYSIDEYKDINAFPEIEKAAGFYSDEGFFKEAVNIMNSYQGKFCTTLVSVTTHIPFELTGISDLDNKLTLGYEDVTEYQDAIFKNYIVSCNFVDYAFGKLIQDLEETGLMEKSIFIVYGDHGSGLTCVEDIKRLYKENMVEYTELDDKFKDVHVPFGIKIPEMYEKNKIDRVVSKIDIKPTIMDLLGIKDQFSIGQSIFTDKDYSFIKGLGYVTSNNYCINNKCYTRNDIEGVVEIEENQKLLKKMEDEIYLSDMIIKNDLLNQNEKP